MTTIEILLSALVSWLKLCEVAELDVWMDEFMTEWQGIITNIPCHSVIHSSTVFTILHQISKNA